MEAEIFKYLHTLHKVIFLTIFLLIVALDTESRGGQRLVCVGDFHLGAHIEKLNQIRVKAPTKTQNPKNALIFGTLDGGIGCFELVEELVFKRLLTLQQRMVNALPHFAGLNPRGYR
jgi:cleavage and polyadenylation specificity factor subunit 1